MKVCKYRLRDLSGVSCSLGISPMKCAFCQSFKAPSAQDRHSADKGTLEMPAKVTITTSIEHPTPVASKLVLQAQTKGGCGCKKG